MMSSTPPKPGIHRLESLRPASRLSIDSARSPNMPAALVNKIHADVAKVLDLPQSREFFKTNSFERVDLSPAQFKDLITNDFNHWSRLIKSVGAKID